MRKVLAIPDTHFPWHHQDTITWIYKTITEKKPDIVIQMGDLYDMYSHSKFAKTHDLMTPKQEIAEGRLGAANMWKHIRSLVPKAKLYQIRGNHDVRAEKRVQEKCPEIESLLEMRPIFEFPGVTTIMDTSEELEIDGAIYTHGTFIPMGAHCKHYMQSVVHGHTHRGSVFFTRKHNSLIWELDCGFASDETSVPLRYTATRRTGWTLGCGWVDINGPQFMPAPFSPKKALIK